MAKKNPHPASVRNRKTATMKDLIDAMLKSYNIDRKFDQTTLMATWNNVMGKAIANRTTKLEVKNEILIVSLNSAPLKHELNNSKGKVVELITKEFGRKIIKDVLFI